jgi:putative drug exporter of the RND superfamily
MENPETVKTSWLARIPSGRITKWLVLLAWVAAVALSGPLAGKLMGAESNDVTSWLPAGAESTEALNIQNEFASPHDIPAVIAYERTTGLTAADKSKLLADIRRYHDAEHVTGKVIGPVFSHDGQAAEVIVVADLGSNYWKNSGSFNDALLAIAKDNAGGLGVHITGPVGAATAQSKAFNGIDTTLLFSALAVVTVLLLITYRSPLLWLLPVVTAGVALTSAQAIIYGLARHAGLTVNAQSAGILTVLVFGAATDYALLLIARYREELHRHHDRHIAMAIALRRAGPAIIASALTVTLGMLCLLVATLNSTAGLGPVAIGLLAVITLLPAMLVIVGRWIFWPLRPKYGTEPPLSRSLWAKVGRVIARLPRLVWILTTLILLAMAYGLTDLRTTTLVGKAAFPTKPDSVIGEEILEKHFPAAGAGTPIVVVGNAGQALELEATLKQVSGVTGVMSPQIKNGHALIEGTLTSDPASQSAYDTVKRARDAVHGVPGANAKVGGETAVTVDTEAASAHDNWSVMPLVLAVVFLILVVLLRALVAPLMLILTVVLSFAAALGASSLIFDHFFHFAGTDASFPLFVFIFLVALGIDYNIFLYTRVREETVRHDTKRGALIALAATGAVITSAGLVLAGTFAVLGTLPIVTFAEIGFAVAFGVLLDTLVVRSVLVTSLTLDIGRHVWWPSRLGRGRASSTPSSAPTSEPAGTPWLRDTPDVVDPEPAPMPDPDPTPAVEQPAPASAQVPAHHQPPRRPARSISGDIRPRNQTK